MQQYVRIAKLVYFKDQNKGINTPERHLGTLSWVYKPSDNPIVFGASNPCWSYRSQDLRPTKTVGIEMHIPPPKCDSFNDYVDQAALTSDSVTTTS